MKEVLQKGIKGQNAGKVIRKEKRTRMLRRRVKRRTEGYKEDMKGKRIKALKEGDRKGRTQKNMLGSKKKEGM